MRRFAQFTPRRGAILVLPDAAHFVVGTVDFVGPARHPAMAVECA